MKFFALLFAILATFTFAEELAALRDKQITVGGKTYTIHKLPDGSKKCPGSPPMSSDRIVKTAANQWQLVLTGQTLVTAGGTPTPHRYKHLRKDHVKFGGRCSGRPPKNDELWEYPIFYDKSFRNNTDPGTDRIVLRKSKSKRGDAVFCGLITHTNMGRLFTDC